MSCNPTYKGKRYNSLEEIKDIIKKEYPHKEGIKIDELPITTTLNDLAEIMAYGNNKIILPGYKVEYSTPLGNKYDTLEEVNNEIRGLANANVEVDLSGIKIPDLTSQIENLKKQLKDFEYEIEPFNDFVDVYTTEGRLRNNEWTLKADGTEWYSGKENKTLTKDNYKGFVLQNRNKLLKISKERAKEIYYAKENNHNTATQKSRDSYAKLETELHFLENLGIKGFIEKNKEYEQSKEIIEQWKKENNIQYDPEEVYSRGQGFYSSIGAYSNLELDLLLKNLIQHIEDNKKADGEFTISAFTKPIDKRLKHIEGTGDRVRFVIYPKSNHIKWAAPTDVHSGSVWDAHEKVSKDKKSELLGVSFTKAPALSNINEVSPNLADIIDNLSHVHNEAGLELTLSNFEIEFDENIDYSTKQIINSVNKILQQKRLQEIDNFINTLEKQC